MIHESEGTEWDVVGVGANSVDYVYRLPAAPATEGQHAKLRIESHTVSCGGQVTTALCTAAAMGLRAKYIGTLGSDTNGFLMKAELGRRGIDLGHAIVRHGDDPAGMLRFANAAASISCTRPGAIPSVPTVAETDAVLAHKPFKCAGAQVRRCAPASLRARSVILFQPP
jgi:sugar/nucleoside kinase (ribokinase family)